MDNIEIGQEVWMINNNRVEKLIVVGYERKKLLYAFSNEIGIDDHYIYLATESNYKKAQEKGGFEIHIALNSIKAMRCKVFLTKDDLIKSL